MQLTLQLNNPRILSSFNSWSRLKILMSCWCGKWSTIILSKLGVSLFISINHFSIPSHYVHLLLLSYLMKRFRSFTLVVRPAKSRMIRQTFRVMVRNEIRSIKKIVFQHSLMYDEFITCLEYFQIHFPVGSWRNCLEYPCC